MRLAVDRYRVVYQLFLIELRFDGPQISRQTRARFSPATMRSHSGTGFRIFLFASVIVHCVCADLFAQNTSEVRRAFANIRSDDIPGNACVAFRWLDEHKEQLNDQLLTELYKTDRQGRDAILIVLYHTASFVPDQRFAQFLMFRLGEHDKYVALHALPGAAHIDAWDFIEKNFGLFEPLLVNQIGPEGDLRTIWATAWLMKKKGIFSMNARLFTPAVLAKAVANLRNDEVEYNASWAARLFLLLGDQGLPALREGASSHDSQQKYLCRALIDAISAGSRRAFGYLSLRVDLWRVPNGTPIEYPAWLDDEMDYYFNRERGPLELQPYP